MTNKETHKQTNKQKHTKVKAAMIINEKSKSSEGHPRSLMKKASKKKEEKREKPTIEMRASSSSEGVGPELEEE